MNLEHRYFIIDLGHKDVEGLPAYVGTVQWSDDVIILDGAVKLLGTGDSPELAFHNLKD
jgi:hypothetical protein